MNHERYMRLALDLALKGEGRVEPNPLVGAIIVRNNKVIGKGYHRYFGGPHAEINAINSVRNPEMLKGATLYLTLEPCVHFGKTPPCAPAIVQCGIKKVVIATRDPNPLVRGKGIALLKNHGIKIIEGILRKEAENINKPFFWRHKGAIWRACRRSAMAPKAPLRRQRANKKGLPYIVAKWAMSLDGKLATRTGDSKWITSEKSRNYARGIRAQAQAVMVGIGTVLKDKPRLLANTKPLMNTDEHRKNPIRIILDGMAKMPLNSNIIKTLSQGEVYVMISSSAPANKVRLLEHKGVRVFRVPALKGRLDFISVLKTLAKNGINRLMIEGGGEVLGSAFDEKVVDEVYAFIAPKIIGGRTSKIPVEGEGVSKVMDCLQLKDVTVKYLKPDMLIHGFCD